MITDGFDSPVGTADERRSASVLPGRWIDANPYGAFYNVTPTRQAYHTGADINLPEDRDAHAPVYAIASGTVIYAKLGGGTWGKLIVIEHRLPSGQTVYSRYAHVESIGVQKGQVVRRGDEIGRIGSAEGQFPYHLHFDISLTSALDRNPEDWPGTDETRLKRDYVNPLTFIRNHRPMTTADELIRAARELLDQALALSAPKPTGDGQRATVSSDIGLNVRSTPSVRGAVKGKLANGEQIVVKGEAQGDGLAWCLIAEGQYAGYCVAKQYLVFDTAVTDNPAALG